MHRGYCRKWFLILELKFQRALYRPHLTIYWGKLNIFNCSRTNRSRVPALPPPHPSSCFELLTWNWLHFSICPSLPCLRSRAHHSEVIRVILFPNMHIIRIFLMDNSIAFNSPEPFIGMPLMTNALGDWLGLIKLTPLWPRGIYNGWSKGKVETSKQQSVTLWSASRGEQYKIPITYPLSGL